MTRTPAPELSPAEAAIVARFDAAPVPPEVVVETVARALFQKAWQLNPSWTLDAEPLIWQEHWRGLAAAAIAALPPSPAELAVKRVDALARLWEAALDHYQAPIVEAARELRAALASPAPAPCWCIACEHLHVRARTEAGDPLAMFARRFIVCPDCGNKRCPKATHHDLACSGSNEPGQPGSAYQQVVAPPASAEELRARILAEPAPAPRDRYALCDGTCTVDCGACKGKGPR